MSVVWKYELVIDDSQVIVMPADADLLHVDQQYGRLCLWARVIPTARTERRVILIRGTGQPIWQQPHIGTVITDGGKLVWHVFDGGTEEDE